MFCNSTNVFVPHDSSAINANVLKVLSDLVYLFIKKITLHFQQNCGF